jgi:alpha-1,2-mannosyltransferase
MTSRGILAALLSSALSAVALATRLPPLVHSYAAAPSGRIADFMYYFAAALRVRHGEPLYNLAEPRTLDGFLYPPPAILLFLPFSALPQNAADLALQALSLGALAASLFLWWARLDVPVARWHRVSFCALALVLGPTWMNFDYGQVNLLALAATVACIALTERGRPWAAGVALSAGVVLKLYPAIVLALAARDARYRRVGLACGAALAVWSLAAAAALGSFGAYGTYLSDVLPAMTRSLPVDVCNQSMAAVVARLGRSPSDLVAEWPVVAAPRAVSVAVSLAALGFVAWVVAWGGRPGSPRRPLAEAALLAVVPLASPLGWGHTFVFVLPLLATVLLGRAPVPWRLASIAAAGALFLQSDERFRALAAAPVLLQWLVYGRYALATMALLLAGFFTTAGATVADAPSPPAPARCRARSRRSSPRSRSGRSRPRRRSPCATSAPGRATRPSTFLRGLMARLLASRCAVSTAGRPTRRRATQTPAGIPVRTGALS